MTRRVPLDNVDHATLKVALRHGAAYGDAVNQVLLLPTEFEEAQRDFPILFRSDPVEGLQAVALLGLARDENLFLAQDRWESGHIPLLLQRGPFSLGIASPASAANGPDEVVHIDLDDPRVGAEDGVPLFLPQGGNGRYLDHVTRVLRLIRQGAEAAGRIYAAWDAHDLFQPLALELALDDETRLEIPGYLGIAEARLAALDGAALEALHRAGYLRPAFLVAASLGNLPRLINRRALRARPA